MDIISHKNKAYIYGLEFSFQLRLKHKLFESVNTKTNKQAKSEVMVQIGLALRNLIASMSDHPKPNLTFLLSKLDIKYGFWCMAVTDEDSWNFCYVLHLLNPGDSIDDIEIMIPNILQMGWCESPPFL